MNQLCNINNSLKECCRKLCRRHHLPVPLFGWGEWTCPLLGSSGTARSSSSQDSKNIQELRPKTDSTEEWDCFGSVRMSIGWMRKSHVNRRVRFIRFMQRPVNRWSSQLKPHTGRRNEDQRLPSWSTLVVHPFRSFFFLPLHKPKRSTSVAALAPNYRFKPVAGL